MFHEKFREIAKIYPGTPAIIWRGEILTYKELDEESTIIAESLKAKGIDGTNPIPIHKERGPEWLIHSLGILKAGAAYVPLSPNTPPERLDFILRDCEIHTTPADAFCVYYTSGSTGFPKGVILSHTGVLAFCETHAGLLGLSHGIKAAVQADVGFDSFLLSTLPILYAGGTLYLMDDSERLSLVSVHRFLLQNKIDTIFLTTQFAVEYMKRFDNKYLKTLLTGGEALRSYTQRSYQVYNFYGPTECTVYVTAYQLKPQNSGDIPIGTTTGKNKIELIDGEICVSGPQVALGYLGHPPFGESYRTGDLAEWSENGELLYRGRIDNMVKINGYRIEPDEVEVKLINHPSIDAACVIVIDETLLAYCVPADKNPNKDQTPESLKAYLAECLPHYMIPKTITMLNNLPLDARTGKVDKAALLLDLAVPPSP